jgi:hypothetical protein
LERLVLLGNIEVGIPVAADVRCTLARVQDRLRQGDAVVLLEVGEAQLHRQAASLQGLAQRRVVLELGASTASGAGTDSGGRAPHGALVTGTLVVVQCKTTARGSKVLRPLVVQPSTALTLIPFAFRIAATLRMPETWKPMLPTTLLVLEQHLVLVQRLVFDLGFPGLAVLGLDLVVKGDDLFGAQVAQPRL